MRLGDGAVVWAAGDGSLELPGQELEFRVIGRPLAQQFGHGARIFDFVRGGPGKMVCCHVSNGVAAGLDGMHAHIGQRIQHIRHILQLGPVVLNVLARREVAIAFVPALGQVGQLAHLGAVERAVRDRNTQHVGV